MQTQSIQTLGQAVDYIGSLPVFEQKQLFGLIDSYKVKHEQNTHSKTEPSELQKSFLEWEKTRQKMIAEFDENEMTDEEFDALMASLKDRNDIGREVSFE